MEIRIIKKQLFMKKLLQDHSPCLRTFVDLHHYEGLPTLLLQVSLVPAGIFFLMGSLKIGKVWNFVIRDDSHFLDDFQVPDHNRTPVIPGLRFTTPDDVNSSTATLIPAGAVEVCQKTTGNSQIKSEKYTCCQKKCAKNRKHGEKKS